MCNYSTAYRFSEITPNFLAKVKLSPQTNSVSVTIITVEHSKERNMFATMFFNCL